MKSLLPQRCLRLGGVWGPSVLVWLGGFPELLTGPPRGGFLGQTHPSKPEMRGRALGWGRHRMQQSSQRRLVHMRMVLPRARVTTCLARDMACLSRGSPTQRVPSDRRVRQTTADSSRNRSARRHQTQPPAAGDAGPPHALLLWESAPAGAT
ncbi:unnamed protein product [Rangifer tarandus platyrhynchus]|uniref:Uncharacterized protein n=2 Tax=Rangifer tarandus platyrhynchus TaxID=3082113 RepID=A0ACB0ETF4_RANTA|nr:unnamed protein product [Rangifer tarandus platyrhynchus]CAI9704042.1 unnamed protein product [Rangifer tarandus platyrhynchus]